MYTLRYYQEECVWSIFDYFERKGGNPVCALPTGTGKALCIAEFLRRVFVQWPSQRVVMLTHVKELIEQNANHLQQVWPTAPLGIYSAGLNSRDCIMPILFGGVQSVAPALKRKADCFGWRDLVIIDEAHLLSDSQDSMYQFVIAQLRAINPLLKVIGFTATPYRMRMGLITDNGIFTDICYDITNFDSFNRLIAEGFLAPLIARPTRTEIDVSNVGITAGEFNQKQLEKAVDTDSVVFNAVKEMTELGYDRKSWLVFASGIDNTEHVSSVIQHYGLDVLPVHSKLSNRLNKERLDAFRAGELRGIVSGQKLTTGFDHPPIDFIADLNPTLSPGKHVQKYGRGTRPSEGKANCLVADFAGNVKRLGPINDPKIPRKPGEQGGEAPVKICDACGVYNHASARQCIACGQPFSFETKLFATAGHDAPMRTDSPVVEYFNVQKVIYNLHEKRSQGALTKPPSIKVSYFCGLNMFNEYVLLEHGGFAAKRSREWWRQRHAEDPPATTYQALARVSELRMPKRIRVWTNKPYPEILSAEW